MSGASWRWDPTLYAGSASYYAEGRVPYPPELADRIAVELGLDGRGRLLDLGCGPGSLTLLLAPWFESVDGVDADQQMLIHAKRRAELAGITNVAWIHRRAEDLLVDLGPYRLATLAQSFHWMNQAHVARLAHALLAAGGALAHVHATTHKGVDGTTVLQNPRPPRAAIDVLIEEFLGTSLRAGQGERTRVAESEDDRGQREAAIYRAADFDRPTRIETAGYQVMRTADQVVASVFSLSYAAPHLFGDRFPDFERELRDLLSAVSPDGRFSEQMRGIAVDIWRT